MGFGRYRFRRSFGQVKSMFRGAIPKHFPLFKGLLGLYPGAAAAYSLRALKSEKDSVVRVRRDSDNEEKDFTASDVSSGALTNWVGIGNDGFVETWYDQSGSGKNAVQLTAGNQPKIVDGGALVTGGIDFNGVDDKMDIPGLSPASLTYSAFTVASIDNFAATSLKSIFDTSDLDDGGFAISYGNTANKLTPFWFDGDDSTANVFSGGSNLTNLESLYSLIIKTGASTTNINGSLNETLTNSFSSAGTNNLSKSTIAYDQSTPSRLLNGKLNELIIYDTDQSVNRTGIEDNINNYYNIY